MAFCIMTPIRSRRLSRKVGNSWTRRRDIHGLVTAATDLLGAARCGVCVRKRACRGPSPLLEGGAKPTGRCGHMVGDRQ